MKFQKTYLSREMTRAMALDHPIGDPTGGPAYGERREPVSAVLAIGSIVAGYGAATAVGATLGAMVLGGMAMASGALSLIGNVTGNEKLSKYGAIIGLISGGLSLTGIASAGAAGAGAGLGAEGAGAAAGAETGADAAAATSAAEAGGGANVQVNAAPTETVAQPTALDSPSLTQPLETSQSLNAPAIEAPAAAAPAPASVQAPIGATPLSEQLPGAVNAVNPGGGGQWMIDDQGSKYFMPDGGGVQPGSVSGAPESAYGSAGAGGREAGLIERALIAGKDMGSGLMDFTKSNPMGAYVAAQAVGGAADMLSGKSAAQKKQLEADAALRQANADKVAYELQLAKDKIAALNSNYKTINQGVTVNPNATVAPVNPATRFVMLPPAQTGLINGARA